MKLCNDYVLRDVAGEYIIVTIVTSTQDFNGIITVDEVGKFLWENMKAEFTVESLVDKVLDEYDIDRDTALADVTDFIEQLKKHSIL